MKKLFFILIFVFLNSVVATAQTTTAWGYNTGYGQVYGSFGLAHTMQSMYNVARAQGHNKTASTSAPKGSGGSSKTQVTSSNAPAAKPAPPSRVVRNYGRFRPDATVDTATALADALGETADEKALIKSIYIATKGAYEKEAASKGWSNNVAGGLTFFTVTAIAVYRDIEDPGYETMAAYYDVMNAALDETPEFATVANKNKQGFNNMLIGFSGLIVASNLEAKENNDPTAIANSKKLAGMLIEMVLKADPESLRIENGNVVMK
ncbi:MAG TPA: DUF6683 family protein [Pyrinomonadaceae bacterium]|nr:DUF6683 family protein [Pyrinomonadaceae bacterium]